MSWLTVTEDDVDKHFRGVMIECRDIGGTHSVPGWYCLHCGWRVGCSGLPPGHNCYNDYPTAKDPHHER